MAEENWKEIFYFNFKEKGNMFIQFLLDAGLDVNALNVYGKTMLTWAAELGNLEITEFLIQNGGDGNVANSDGSNPLHVASQCGSPEIVKYFLKRGISANSCDNYKNTPLHYVAECHLGPARKKSHREIVDLLIDSDADLNSVNVEGHTPLILADQYSRKHVAELLIKFGATFDESSDNHEPHPRIYDPHMDEQYTLLHYACQSGYLDINKFLS